MCRWDGEHVREYAVDVVITKAVAVRDQGRIRSTERGGHIPHELGIWVKQRLNVLSRVGKNHQAVLRISQRFGVVSGRAERQADTTNRVVTEAPIERPMHFPEAQDTFEVTRLAPDARRVVMEVYVKPRRP